MRYIWKGDGDKKSEAIDLIALRQKLRKIYRKCISINPSNFQRNYESVISTAFARFNAKIVLNANPGFCTFISLPEWNLETT